MKHLTTIGIFCLLCCPILGYSQSDETNANLRDAQTQITELAKAIIKTWDRNSIHFQNAQTNYVEVMGAFNAYIDYVKSQGEKKITIGRKFKINEEQISKFAESAIVKFTSFKDYYIKNNEEAQIVTSKSFGIVISSLDLLKTTVDYLASLGQRKSEKNQTTIESHNAKMDSYRLISWSELLDAVDKQ